LILRKIDEFSYEVSGFSKKIRPPVLEALTKQKDKEHEFIILSLQAVIMIQPADKNAHFEVLDDPEARGRHA
jgi:hypothetical protein